MEKNMNDIKPGSQLLIYQNPDGTVKIDVLLEEETVWLTQDHMADLFGKAKSASGRPKGSRNILSKALPSTMNGSKPATQ